MEVPLVIIHFRLGFSLINHPLIGVPHGTPICGNPTLVFSVTERILPSRWMSLRQVYDTYGDEERMPQQQRHHYQQDFMTPEDPMGAESCGGGRELEGVQGGAPPPVMVKLVNVLQPRLGLNPLE